jgi:hypothetical protein
MEDGMRKSLLVLFCAGSLAGTAAQAANNDILELGLGARLLFDSDTYGADNPNVDYATDVFPIIGDQALGIGIHAALGHRFDSRRGPYEVLLKYYYSIGNEEEGTYDLTGPSGDTTYYIVGRLDQHDVLLAFRLPGTMMPLPILDWEKLYYDLGLGVTTLSYEFAQVNTTTLATYETPRTRSGLAYNFGMGWRHELSEEWTFSLRADFVLGKIQDIESASGRVVRAAPDAHGARLQVSMVRYFRTLF